jgi:hypothetical protein
LKNNSKINTSKGKLYFTVLALASLLVMSFNLNTNMNAYASIFENIQNIDDIGQSTECVIVVVGCDGTGSVGSSGDTIIGSFNGNNDNNTTLEPPVPRTCEECFTFNLTPEEIMLIEDSSGNTIEEICLEFASLASLPPETAAEELAELEQGLVEEFGVDTTSAQAVIDCLVVIFGL